MPTAWFAACLLAFVALGCASTDNLGPVERAKLIHENVSAGQETLVALQSQFCSNNPDRDLEQTVRGMEKARRSFEEAVKLGPESHKGRRYLGDCLQLMGFEYRFEHDKLLLRAQPKAAKGGRPEGKEANGSRGLSAADQAKLAQYEAKYKEYLQASNKEYRFYERFIHTRHYPDVGIFDTMRMNYELLEDWANAIEVGRKFIAETQLQGPALEQAEKILRQYEQKLLEQQGDDPEL
ncbi:MAG: hypothetical protein AB7O52_01230 [Planctomycetota bacterium]